VPADRLAPLDALLGPLARDLRRPLRRGEADGRQRQAARVQRRQRDLEALALAPDEVLLGDEDVLEQRHGVLDAAQAHERVAVLDAHALGVVGQHERADAAAPALALGHLGHDDHDVGDRAVGGPQLAAVEAVAAAVLGRRRRGAETRRVRADVGLGQQERGDVGARDLRQPLALLGLGAEQQQRLGDADRLVRRQQRAERRVPGAHERQRPVVVHLRQAEPAVLLGHLHPERAEVLEAVDHGLGDLRVALDLQRIDVLGEEGAQPLQERLALLHRGGVELGLRVDQVEVQAAEEEVLAEARQLPLALAGVLGDLTCLAFGDVGGHGAPVPDAYPG
jgi:hypothetical protein